MASSKAANLRWRAKHPEKYAAVERAHHLQRYNLTPVQYDEMLASQHGVCAICHIPSALTLCVDHDHECCPERKRSCGKCVRELICSSCNNGLGRFKDSVRILTNAVAYVTKHRRWMDL